MAKKQLRTEQVHAIALMVAQDVNKLTMKEIATEVGVARSTLYEWKKDPDFTNELNKQAEAVQRAFLAEAYAELRGLIKGNGVSDGNKLKGLDLYLRNQGRLKDVQEQTVTVQEKSLDDMLAELDN